MSEYEHAGTWTDVDGNKFEVENKLDVLLHSLKISSTGTKSHMNRPDGFDRRQMALEEARNDE